MSGQPRRAVLWLGTLFAVGCKLDKRRAIDLVAPDSMFPDDEGANVEDFRETESGLLYRVITPGNQKKRVKLTSTVTVHYRGWLDDKTEVDSSYKRGKPLLTKVSGIMPGWTEALLMMTEGEVVELIVPPELGYGKRGKPPIVPPNATLHFRIELLEVR
jgi:FKBP-type peptidyl-prolyl cis-trans isomerase